jgi:hypothetical protein
VVVVVVVVVGGDGDVDDHQHRLPERPSRSPLTTKTT